MFTRAYVYRLRCSWNLLWTMLTSAQSPLWVLTLLTVVKLTESGHLKVCDFSYTNCTRCNVQSKWQFIGRGHTVRKRVSISKRLRGIEEGSGYAAICFKHSRWHAFAGSQKKYFFNMHPWCILERRVGLQSPLKHSWHLTQLRSSPNAHYNSRQQIVLQPFFTLISPLVNSLRTSLLIMLASGHLAIIEISKHYFLHPSNQVRPVICLGAGGRAEEPNPPLTRPDVLNKLWTRNTPSSACISTNTLTLETHLIHLHPLSHQDCHP